MEFVTGSLTADPDPRTIAPEDLLHAAEAIMLQANAPYLKQIDLLHQGYTVVDVTPDEALVEFRVLDTFDPDAEASTFARFRVVAGRPGIEVLASPASSVNCACQPASSSTSRPSRRTTDRPAPPRRACCLGIGV
jgi:hypothetical protein